MKKIIIKGALTWTVGGGLLLVSGARIGSSCAARFGTSPIPAIFEFFSVLGTRCRFFFFTFSSFFAFFLAQSRSAFALGRPIEKAKLD